MDTLQILAIFVVHFLPNLHGALVQLSPTPLWMVYVVHCDDHYHMLVLVHGSNAVWHTLC